MHGLAVWRTAGFAVGMLALGMAAAGLGYGVFGPVDDARLVDPPLWPPRWWFWAVWIVLYPTIGVAGAYLWRARTSATGARAWPLFLASVAVGLAWVPIVQASGSRVVMPVLMDAASLAVALIAFAAARRASARAAAWLLPSLGWGVATTLLKVWRLMLNV